MKKMQVVTRTRNGRPAELHACNQCWTSRWLDGYDMASLAAGGKIMCDECFAVPTWLLIWVER